MPIGVRLRSSKRSISMAKKGKIAASDFSDTKKNKNKDNMYSNESKLREKKRDRSEALSSINHGKEEKAKYKFSRTRESVPSDNKISIERKFGRTRTESEDEKGKYKLSQTRKSVPYDKRISTQGKFGRIRSESKALVFDERVLSTVKFKHNREYGKGDEHQRQKGKVYSKNEISKGKANSKDEISEEKDEDKEDEVQFSKPQVRRLLPRVLDKTGKKVRFNRKELASRSEENSALVKRKRVIKIDPYDGSNKRLDDIPLQKENVEEKVVEMSKNAQFRAIQPSSSILSFVEDNLLGRRRLNELKDAGYNMKLSAPLDNIPFSKSLERERIEQAVFRNRLEFFAAAKLSSSFPPPVLPEIAFAGRSNVGKSSLLNALTRQWGVVRTSDKPGLTQTLNFFRLASKLCLVDLPGYGFAYAKDEVKESWEELVKEYVSTRAGLQRVCLLVDTKWGMKPRDQELVDLMERSQTPYQIVLTKTDIVFPIDVARRAMQIQESLKQNKSVINPVMMVSSKTGGGIRYFRTILSKLARFTKP